LNVTIVKLLKPNRYFPVPTRLETVMIGSLNDPLKFNLVDVRCQSVQHNSGSFPWRTKIFTLSIYSGSDEYVMGLEKAIRNAHEVARNTLNSTYKKMKRD
jgi:hypothetical protein